MRKEVNKYQEAWDFINTVSASTDRNRIMPLKELVDKETPMKVIANIFNTTCPNCHKKGIINSDDWGYGEKHKYCTQCGQRIDWSKDNE